MPIETDTKELTVIVSQIGRKAIQWLRQAFSDRRTTLALSQMNTHTLHDLGIDRGGIDYAVRDGRIVL